MNSTIENSLPGQTDWKHFLESAETLLKQTSLKDQSRHLTKSITDLFNLKANFWFAHPLYPLPGERDSDVVSSKEAPHPLVAQTYAQRQPLFLDSAHQTVSKLNRNEKLLQVCLPVFSDKDMLGILLIEPLNEKVISAKQVVALQTYAAFCALPMQIYRQTVLKNWRVAQLAIVREVSEKIANITDMDYLCEQVADAVQEKFQYYFISIYTNEKDGVLQCRSSASIKHPPRQSPKIEVASGQGIVGWVAEHKEELYVEDTCCHPIYRFHELVPEAKSEAAFPLMIGEKCLGVMDVQSDLISAFHEMDLVVLRTMADNIAIAIEGAHLYAGVQRQAEQISTVVDISHALSSILDLDMLLEEVVNTIQKQFQYLQVNVFTVHKGRGKIIFQAGTGERSQAYRDSYLTLDLQDPEGILSWVAREERTFVSNDVLNEPQYRKPDLPTTARSEIAVPLIAGGEIVGILDIQSDQVNAFDRADRYLFEALAAGIATSIRNATLYRSELFRRQVAESVRDIAGIVSNGSSLNNLMDRILQELRASLPCDAASIWLCPENKQEETLLSLAAFSGISPQRLQRTYQTKETAGEWILEALKSNEPIIRKTTDPRGPIGEALNLLEDYSAIAAPLRAGGTCVGILTLAHHQPGRYGSEARLITQTFAGYAAVAIQNSRLYTSAQEQAWIATILLRVAEANKAVLSLEALAETTVRLIPELLGCSTCAYYCFNPPLNRFERKATFGFPADALPAKSFDKEQPAILFASKLLTPIAAYYTHGDFSLSPVRDVPAGLLVPLVTRGHNLGLIWVGSSDDGTTYNDRAIQVLSGISHQTATAMENLQLLENQQQDAFIAAALLQVAQTVASQEDLAKILDTILNLLSILAGVESAAFFLTDLEQPGFQPVTSFIGINDETIRSMGTRLFPGDFPLLDLITDRNLILLSPLNYQQKSAIHWPIVKHITRMKEAFRQKPPEGGWLVGIPLSGKGEVFGALIILEKPVTGTLLEKRLDLLTGIARQAALAIQNDHLQKEKLEKEKLQQEFQFARQIQQTFLPRQIPTIKGWDFSSLWQPANQVGGDFFDIFMLPPDKFCAVIADVSDKGMPAALYMTVTRTLVRSFAQEELSPGKILKKVNDLLLQDNPTGMFVTSAIIIGSANSGEIQYANAGHNRPVFRTAENLVEELPQGQIALGVLENQVYQDHLMTITSDSLMVLYTDGVTDTVSPAEESYSIQRLVNLVGQRKYRNARDFTTTVENDLVQFRAGQASVDDITMLALHRL